MTQPSFQTPSVKAVFDAWPLQVKQLLLRVRALIFDCAHNTPRVGQIEETLKWGQPAYLTTASKSGTTIRLGLHKQGGAALFVHCQTSVISDFQTLFPDEFAFDGTRAVHFDSVTEANEKALRMLIQSALTYHLKQGRIKP